MLLSENSELQPLPYLNYSQFVVPTSKYGFGFLQISYCVIIRCILVSYNICVCRLFDKEILHIKTLANL